MKHGAMANRRVIADVQWGAPITVQDAAILHVAAIANHDRLIVSPHNRRKPDARVLPQHNIADDLGRWREPDVVSPIN